METAGYIASIFIGISLGLIGGGGSTLAVPVMVYLFSKDAVLATTYSLFVVGITSVIGSLSYIAKGLVKVKTALIFGLPSIVTIFLTRHFILPAIPMQMGKLGSFSITKNLLLMVIFAVLMVFAAFSMIRKGSNSSWPLIVIPICYPKVMLQGAVVGLLTGLVGAGGGFLIIPALVKLLKMPIKTAVGTSLFIISINSLTGFVFSMAAFDIQWSFLLTITGIAILGILIGSYLSTKIDGKRLKPAFGWFVLCMGVYILTKEFFV